MDLNKIIRFIQVFAVLLIFIGSLIGFFQEISHMVEIRKIQLADLLLLFIYVEVMGMISLSSSRRNKNNIPLNNNITAISRLIISKKDLDPAILIYESVAILILAIAIIVLKMRYINFFKDDNSNDKN